VVVVCTKLVCAVGELKLMRELTDATSCHSCCLRLRSHNGEHPSPSQTPFHFSHHPVVASFEPTAKLSISYGGHEVSLASSLSPQATSSAPHVAISGKGLYTLLMVDPDAPSRENPKYAQWLHWMVTNIHNDDVTPPPFY
jgi:hypothetical protein